MANFLDSTPLSGFFYNPEKDQDKIDQGIAQGTQAWNNLTPTAYENRLSGSGSCCGYSG